MTIYRAISLIPIAVLSSTSYIGGNAFYYLSDDKILFIRIVSASFFLVFIILDLAKSINREDSFDNYGDYKVSKIAMDTLKSREIKISELTAIIQEGSKKDIRGKVRYSKLIDDTKVSVLLDEKGRIVDIVL